jgi:hypothetical protein
VDTGENNNQLIQTKIPVIFFEEGDKIIAYSPALDLSTCGDTEQLARSRFTEATTIFFDEIVNMGTAEEVLTECGWHKSCGGKTWQPPVLKSYSEEIVQIPEGVY